MSAINSLFGLNIRLFSFELPSNLVKHSDEIRVSITTLPEENKQAFIIPARKMKDSNLVFGVNVNIPQENFPNDFVSTGTENIVLVFRKKSFFNNNPIIASTTIDVKELPKNLSQPAMVKTFNIYEPRKCNQNEKTNYHSKSCLSYENSHNSNNRRIIGRMQVQLSLTDPFHLKEFDSNDMFDLDNNTEAIESKHSIQKNPFYGFKMLNH